ALGGDVVHADGNAQHGCQGDEVGAHVAVDCHTVVGAPVCHDAVHIPEGSLPGQVGHEPGGGPGAVGALVQDAVLGLGQRGGVALGNLQHGADTLGNADTQQRDRHLGLGLEVAGESAAAEVLIVGTAPV